jgi:hypothetical protein
MENMLGTLKRKLAKLPKEALGTMLDLLEKLLSKAGPEWLAKLKKFLRVERYFTELISGKSMLFLSGVDEKNRSLIPSLEDIFSEIHIDSLDCKLGDRKLVTTRLVRPEVHKLVRNATFAQMFGELASDLSKLFFSLDQLKMFVDKYPEWLEPTGYGTFFLLEINGHFYVAQVRRKCYGQHEKKLIINDFNWLHVCEVVYPYRLVVPKLD